MIKNVAIVSLSKGTIGESFVKHELEIGIKRLEEMGLCVRFMPHALMGIEYVQAHPEKRAEDLLAAFRDPDIDMILCAIGGDDTYRMLPYLFDHDELREAVSEKVFLGFSDTTINHFMLRKAGLATFYGQSFLADVCELEDDMLPYTKWYFEELIRTGTIKEIRPSGVWYEGRKDFSPDQIGVPLVSHPDSGFDLIQGAPVFSGEILGGCIDSMYDMFSSENYGDMPYLCRKYGLFPDSAEWTGKILLLESSELKMPPDKYRKALEALKERGVYGAVSGVLVGKPMDGAYAVEYREALKEVVADPALPIVCNINVGHAQPRCIIPFGVPAEVDAVEGVIRFSRRSKLRPQRPFNDKVNMNPKGEQI
ncbi:MAG: LD-carboxypeptidase [Clostridia bacterium]|nr:LD-carboxypeptidase [Clostridia bacterium]